MRPAEIGIFSYRNLLIAGFFLAVMHLPLFSSGQIKDTVYFNPLIDDIIQRIPPLEDLIDSAIVHNPQVKVYDADIQAWRYRVKTAGRTWMKNLFLDLYLENSFWDAITDNTNAPSQTVNTVYTYQNNYRGLGSLEIKMPLMDLWDRKNQIKTATKEIEKSIASREGVILALRQTIITNYNQLIVNQKILKNANESVIAGAMNKEMGDKEFINGQSTLYDLAYIMEMYRVAVYNYETSRNQFFNSYMILQELCGFKFNVINKID